MSSTVIAACPDGRPSLCARLRNLSKSALEIRAPQPRHCEQLLEAGDVPHWLLVESVLSDACVDVVRRIVLEAIAPPPHGIADYLALVRVGLCDLDLAQPVLFVLNES